MERKKRGSAGAASRQSWSKNVNRHELNANRVSDISHPENEKGSGNVSPHPPNSVRIDQNMLKQGVMQIFMNIHPNALLDSFGWMR